MGVKQCGAVTLLPQALLGWLAMLLAVSSIRQTHPLTLLWAAPCLLIAAVVITWGAESAQFFIAQGFALAILAWLQTLPEFAVEAVLAWRQQVPNLMANLTGALRMLTGLGWPMIYFASASVHRKRTGRPLRRIELDSAQCVSVVGLLAPLLYMGTVVGKRSIGVWDSGVLILLYAAYLAILSRMPATGAEGIDDLERVPRAIVRSPRPRRLVLIALCFLTGGGLIYLTAEPFLASLIAVAALAGIPSFIMIQWVAPFVSEFPEMASTFYFARTVTGAPMALMNMVSSNINQWTLLAALLPLIYSLSRGSVSAVAFDDRQTLEVLMTLGQALVGMLFLVNMELAWWEAAVLFSLWLIQFAFSAAAPGIAPSIANHRNVHWYITLIYFGWAAWELLRLMARRRRPVAFIEFGRVWRQYVRGRAPG